jgi:hypothetical protein
MFLLLRHFDNPVCVGFCAGLLQGRFLGQPFWNHLGAEKQWHIQVLADRLGLELLLFLCPRSAGDTQSSYTKKPQGML